MGKNAGLLLRVVARGIDLILVLAAVEGLPKTGWAAGVCYVLVGDGLMQGRSLGKRLVGLRVLESGGRPCSLRCSILRNLTIAFGLVLWKVPFIGWLLLGAVLAFEFIILLGGGAERGRLGDEIAGTSVVDEQKAEAA